VLTYIVVVVFVVVVVTSNATTAIISTLSPILWYDSKHVTILRKLIFTILIISDMTYKPRPPIIEGKGVCSA
jgi:hypothetical protein